jgi:hypothetical protein
MALIQASASFYGRGDLTGPWPPAPIYATPGVPGVPGVIIDGSRAYAQVSGPCCDPAWAGPGPPIDPQVAALNASFAKVFGSSPGRVF